MASLKMKCSDAHHSSDMEESLTLLKDVKQILDCVWRHLNQRKPQSQGNTISLPYQTLRYVDEVEKAFESSYQDCPGNKQQRATLKQVEIECHALAAGINARELPTTSEEFARARAIFIALRVLIKEFKDDRMQDGAARFELFSTQLKKLVAELADVFEDGEKSLP